MKSRSLSRILSAAIAAILMLCAVGCAGEKALKTYRTDAGLTVTMHEGMVEFEAGGITAALADDSCMMTAVRHDYQQFTDLGFDITAMTAEEYAALSADLTGTEQEFSFDSNGNYHTTYTAVVDGDEYFYYGVIVKGTDAFWLVTFTCEADRSGEYAPLFAEWSGSVEVE